MTAEQGKPLAEAHRRNRFMPAAFLEWFGEEGRRATYGEI
jgi:hypothetical protein